MGEGRKTPYVLIAERMSEVAAAIKASQLEQTRLPMTDTAVEALREIAEGYGANHTSKWARDTAAQAISALEGRTGGQEPWKPDRGEVVHIIGVEWPGLSVRRCREIADRILALPPAPADEKGEPKPEKVCECCGRGNPVWFAPSPLWNLVVGGPEARDDPGGMLCPVCFIEKAEKSGVRPTAWIVQPEQDAEAPPASPSERERMVGAVRGVLLRRANSERLIGYIDAATSEIADAILKLSGDGE